MDDHGASATDFDTLFTFLHTQYFFRCAFGPVYLSGHKTQLLLDSLGVLGIFLVGGSRPRLHCSVGRAQQWGILVLL